MDNYNAVEARLEWPYRFYLDGTRPLNYYVGIAPFNNWLQCRGFDGWYGVNPLTTINDDPDTDPSLLSTGGDGISDGWKYFFWGTARNDANMIGTALGAFTDPNLPIPTVVIPNNVIVGLLRPSVNVAVENDEDNDCHQLNNEFLSGTDPVHWDTDADSISDGYEAYWSLNPIDGTDGSKNYSGDWMAYLEDAGAENRHNQVYSLAGFDPRTGWGQNYYGRGTIRGIEGQVNTVAFNNKEKFFGSVYLAAASGGMLTCQNFGSYALNPNVIDTDGDGIFDGWELYVGLNPMDPLDAGSDGDDDSLSSFAEFSCLDLDLTRGTPWPNGRQHFDQEWLNKVWPTDPSEADTDGDGIKDGAEGGYRELDEEIGGLAVLKYSGGERDWTGSCYTGGGLNPTSVDTDDDRLPDHWEAAYRSRVFSYEDQEERNGMDPTLKDHTRDYDGDGLLNYQEYLVGAVYHFNYGDWVAGLGLFGYNPMDFFTGTPFEWDWHFETTSGKWPYYFIPPMNNRYSTTSPRVVDTDGDMMDDFHEMYHGLNPIFGTYDMYFSKLAGGLVLAAFPANPDIRVNPYAAGSQYADPDQDGMPNSEEALVSNWPTPRYYHTDPSPLWVTDPSYQLSWVNLYYYWPDGATWYWDNNVLKGTRLPPAYAFSFESVEGFDTDNDGLGDRAELVHTPVSPGSTDPLSSESPPRRRALHLDGDAAARTRGVFYHDATYLENFTIEAWVRSENPASGQLQVILERPMFLPVGNVMGNPDAIRLNFRLALDEAGRPFVAYNGAGFDALYVEAKAPSTRALNPDEWYHLAGVYDGAQQKLYIYVNGEMLFMTPSAEKPANGWINGNPGWVHMAPMVLGARDANPDGWVNGMPIMVGPYAGNSLTQPLLDSFFQGWVDEIRVWDGARSEAQIQAAMMTPLKMADVKASVEARALSLTAPQLVYLYNFDDLNDPMYEGIVPWGFNLLNGRPDDGSYPHSPWWGTANDRSLVYSDHTYIPWIGNVAARLPLDPPADTVYWVQQVVETEYTVVYTTNGVGDEATVAITTNETTTITTNIYPNTANPYNFGYYHDLNTRLENHPDYINNAHLIFNPRNSSLFNDLLPLRNARADASVELWDNGGPGVAEFDSNGDGIPDSWAIFYGYDPNEDIAALDPDGDGLSNYWEYKLGLNPFSVDSDGDGVADEDEDTDGDGLSNANEAALWGTDPADPDTDDDGISDGVELDTLVVKQGRRITNPRESRSPLVQRSAVLDGVPVEVPAVHGFDRFSDMKTWTLECWVNLADGNQTGSLLKHTVDANGQLSFDLRVDANVPSVRFTTAAGVPVSAGVAGRALPANTWAHLAGVFNAENKSLALYVNGYDYAAQATVFVPASGKGRTVIGDGVQGLLDEVRLWNRVRSSASLDFWLNRHLFSTSNVEDVPPLDITFLVDVSGSMGPYITQVKSNITEFVLGLDARGFDVQLAGVRYSDTLEGGGTSDTPPDGAGFFATAEEFLAGWLDPLGLQFGGDLPEDGLAALVYAMEAENFTPSFRSGAQKIFVLITDASVKDTEDGDTGAVLSLNQVIAQLQANDIIVQGIFRDASDVGSIVDETGGTRHDIDTSDYSVLFSKMILDIVAQTRGLRAYYPFDDGENTSVVNAMTGMVKGYGAEDFTERLDWKYALGVAGFSLNAAAVRGDADLDLNGMADWWEGLFCGTLGCDPEADSDGDGLINRWEYLLDYNPLAPDTDNNGVRDGDEDLDGDGVSNLDEISVLATSPLWMDTDDDGYLDGAEIAWNLPDPADNFGIRKLATGPADSLSPSIRRSYVAGGRTLQVPGAMGLLATDTRFGFIPASGEAPASKVMVTITEPADDASVAVRFVTVKAEASSPSGIQSMRLVNNGILVRTYSGASSIDETIIISAGTNRIEVVATDMDGEQGRGAATITGTFVEADIRVTQTWDLPGDLDTWLVDPQGRHMGWTSSGPGYPSNVAQRIPNSMLDIDDIPGTGPENVTVDRGFAVDGQYQVWMNNFSHRNNPQSTVRVLVLEGRTGRRYVEFGPQPMPVSDGNGQNSNAWWLVTTIDWPSGTMNPPGRSLTTDTGDEDAQDPETGTGSAQGWTAEAWVKPLNNAQSGAILKYVHTDGQTGFVAGLATNRPFARVLVAGGSSYDVFSGALASNEWTHLAFVFSEGDRSLRIYVNGMMAIMRQVLETRVAAAGRLFVDTFDQVPAQVFSSTRLDEIRVWSRARNGGMIAANMRKVVYGVASLVASFRFDDGGLGIEDSVYPLDRAYNLGGFPLPDALRDAKPGPDGIWGTADDVPAGVGADGHNDYVTCADFAPVIAVVDSDEDGLPDWWELLFFGDTLAADPAGDEDADGLTNLYEFYANTNPKDSDTDANGILDTDEDPDGDQLVNIEEQRLGSHPRLPDTDDDGILDGFEARKGSSPADGFDPPAQRAVKTTGSASSFVEMPQDGALALESWTIAALCKPASISNNSELVARQVKDGWYNYRLGWWADGGGAKRAAVEFHSGSTGAVVRLWASNAIPTNAWTHLAATFNASNGLLALYINGAQVRAMTTERRPLLNAAGPVRGMIGRNFNGLVDEVALYDAALAPAEVLQVSQNYQLTQPGFPAGLVAYYAFDDGTHPTGVSGNPAWREGQIQDATGSYPLDWMVEWRHGATLRGGATTEITRREPGVLYVTSPNPDGIYYPGQTITVWVVFSEKVGQVVGGPPLVELKISPTNRFATYVSGPPPATNILAFRYVVHSNDWSWDLDYVSTNSLLPNGGAILDTHGAYMDIRLPVPGAYGSLGWNKDLFVDPPEPGLIRGMGANWLLEHFGTTDVDPNADFDEDGLSNLMEYRAGTDPKDKDSVLALWKVEHPSGELVISWKSVAGRTYRVESANSALAPAWEVLASGVEGTGAVTTLRQTLPAGVGTRWFRVIVE